VGIVKISVFIPVYNGAKYIRQTLDSVLCQSYCDYEIVCVDDSSKDDSFDILQEYQSKDSRVRALRKENGGDVPHSWNYVFPLLEGEFTIYMSQDDLLKPDALELLVKRQEESGADAVIPAVVFYEEGKTACRTDRGVDGDVSVELTGREAFELSLDYTIPGFALWRTDLIRKEGMLQDAFNSDELAQRLWMLKCDKVVFSDAEFLYRQDNPEAITKSLRVSHYTSIITNMHLLDSMIENGVDNEKVRRLNLSYFKSLFYLSACLEKHEKIYESKDVLKIKDIVRLAYGKFSNVKSFDNIVLRLASINYFMFSVLSKVYSFKI